VLTDALETGSGGIAMQCVSGVRLVTDGASRGEQPVVTGAPVQQCRDDGVDVRQSRVSGRGGPGR
jgi:hypothetical protein